MKIQNKMLRRHKNLRNIVLAVMPERRPDSDICAVVSQLNKAQRYILSRSGCYPTANDVSRYGSILGKPTASEGLIKNLDEAVLLGLAVSQKGHYHLTSQGLDLCTPKGSDCPFATMNPKERQKAGKRFAESVRETKLAMHWVAANNDGTKLRAGRPIYI